MSVTDLPIKAFWARTTERIIFDKPIRAVSVAREQKSEPFLEITECWPLRSGEHIRAYDPVRDEYVDIQGSSMASHCHATTVASFVMDEYHNYTVIDKYVSFNVVQMPYLQAVVDGCCTLKV